METKAHTTLLNIIKAEGPINKINPTKQDSHKIGYNYARKFLATKDDFINNEVTYKQKTLSQHLEDCKSSETPISKEDLVEKFLQDTPQSRLVKNTRRWRTYQVFKSLIESYDHSKYSNGESAFTFPEECENLSKKDNPNTRTSICSLIGRILILVNKAHVQEMSHNHANNVKIQREQKKIANDKRILKMNKMIDRYGEEGFNHLKQTQKAASNIRKANEVTGDIKKELKFVEWRKSSEGLSYDKALIPGLLRTVSPIYKYGRKVKDLGSTDFKGMSEMVRIYIFNSLGIKIQFDVQRDDSTTQLYQHIYLRDLGVLPLKNVDHFNSDGVVFEINNYHHGKNNTLYVNLDNKSTTCNRLLPKEWSHFENWKGYGIVGNPKISTYCKILIKIVPKNIKMFQFTYNEETYRINHTRNTFNVQTLSQIRAKIQNKYESVHQKLQQAVKEKREKDSKKARTKNYDKVMNDFFGGKSTLEQLTDLLAQGKISGEAYKTATKALN